MALTQANEKQDTSAVSFLIRIINWYKERYLDKRSNQKHMDEINQLVDTNHLTVGSTLFAKRRHEREENQQESFHVAPPKPARSDSFI